MSEHDPRCEAFADVAAEFALGLLGGEARAYAIAHLDSCARCRVLVEGLSEAGDTLLAAVPGAEPPAGFEERVLARTEMTIAPRVTARRAPRRRLWVNLAGWVAAAACFIALLVVTVVAPSSPALAEGTMRTPRGTEVGEVYVHAGDHPWLLVSVPGWAPAGSEGVQYELRVRDRAGHTTTYSGVSLDWGQGSWGTTLRAGPKVAAVAIVDGSGTVWCSATVST